MVSHTASRSATGQYQKKKMPQKTTSIVRYGLMDATLAKSKQTVWTYPAPKKYVPTRRNRIAAKN
tara:strand:- start:239 stop:433 length:195 start_codon:yes stop_codon:yes gene_type:complete